MPPETELTDNAAQQIPYAYVRIFNPDRVQMLTDNTQPLSQSPGDQRDGSVYVYDEDIVLAVNVALVTGRPLLVSGPPGCGKSSLGAAIARSESWRHYEHVITSRTRARDLLWTFDAVGRLNDAQANDHPPTSEGLFRYIIPGVLWWAFEPDTATRRGFPTSANKDPLPFRALRDTNAVGEISARAVVVIDEIDKADPEVPNNLLEVLGSLQFTVLETGTKVTAAAERPPLLILTDNRERELPPAFLRRCVLLELKAPNAKDLERIGAAHFGDKGKALYGPLAEQTIKLAKEFEDS